MTVPEFAFDAEANGYISNEITVEELAMVHIELSQLAPVLVLKKGHDGEYSNYVQTPEESDCYELNITSNQTAIIKLATPVEVKKCYIIN